MSVRIHWWKYLEDLGLEIIMKHLSSVLMFSCSQFLPSGNYIASANHPFKYPNGHDQVTSFICWWNIKQDLLTGMGTAGKQWGWKNKTNIWKLCYRGTWDRSLYFRLFRSLLQLLLMEVLRTQYSQPHNQLRRINEGYLPLRPARGWNWVHC